MLEEAGGVRIHDNLIAENGVKGEVPAVGLFVDTCLGLEVSDNIITDNGVGGDGTREVVDFSGMDPKKPLSNPYQTAAKTEFLMIDKTGNTPKEIPILSDSEIVGMNAGSKTVIKLAKPVSQVLLSMAWGSDARPKARAMNAAGDIVAEAETAGEGTNTEILDLAGLEIVQVEINNASGVMVLIQAVFDAAPPYYQGGIIAQFVLSEDYNLAEADQGSVLPFSLGSPAARVQNNVVVAPRGQALLALGLGAMAVSGNSFTTRGVWRQPLSFGEIADTEISTTGLFDSLQAGKCVTVVNMGQAIELFGLVTLFRGLSQIVGAQESQTVPQETQEPAFNVSSAPTAAGFGLVNGRVLFNDNQVTYEQREITGTYVNMALAIASFDDVSVQDNQVMTVSLPITLFATGIIGATTRVANNRFSELQTRAFASCVTLGFLMNNTTGNQCTHCLFTLPFTLAGNIVAEHNQMLFTPFCKWLLDFFE